MKLFNTALLKYMPTTPRFKTRKSLFSRMNRQRLISSRTSSSASCSASLSSFSVITRCAHALSKVLFTIIRVIKSAASVISPVTGSTSEPIFSTKVPRKAQRREYPREPRLLHTPKLICTPLSSSLKDRELNSGCSAVIQATIMIKTT